MHKAEQQYMQLIETLTYSSVSLIQMLSLYYDLSFIFAVAYPQLQWDMQMGPKQGGI